MFIKATPEDFLTSYYLINTDQIAFAYSCRLECRHYHKHLKGTPGLCIKFSSGEYQTFKGLTLEKLERLLVYSNKSAIIDARYEDINEVQS